MREPTPTVCAAVGCDEPRQSGKYYCTAHAAAPPKGEVKRLESKIMGGRARSSITSIFIVSLLVTVAGIFIADVAASTTSIADDGTVTTGSDAGFALGLFVTGIGSMLMFIAVVAWGVMLGTRAARDYN